MSCPDRLREAAKHGLRRAIVPKVNVPKGGEPDLQIQPVLSLQEAIEGL
jgi:DNA repair protein RadA/Sms